MRKSYISALLSTQDYSACVLHLNCTPQKKHMCYLLKIAISIRYNLIEALYLGL